MVKYKSILTAAFLAALLFGMVLTPSALAYLVIDAHMTEDLVDNDGNVIATAYVSIDRLEYDPAGEGVVYLDGTFFLYNHSPQMGGISYDGELRLEIFDEDGNTYTPDSKEPIDGTVERNDEDAHWSDVFFSIPESTNLHIPCLTSSAPDGKPIGAGDDCEMSANITLRVYQGNKQDTWTISHSLPFTHEPQGETGLGATNDGETFSGECDARGGDSWQSLIKTEGPYDQVYWYVKAPGDTGYGTWIKTDQGDGVERKSTMTYTFPEDVDDPNKEGDQQGVYYEITAYVYRWDLSVYWDSYKVWVIDKK